MAAHTKWAGVSDPKEHTAPARQAFMDSFMVRVDPDGVLPEEERLRRAAHLRKAHFARLALLSAQARKRRAS